MSDLRRILAMTIDVDGGQRVELPTDATVFQLASTPQELWRGTQNVFRADLFHEDATTRHQPAAGATWYFGIDSVFTPDHADLVETLNADFNLVADWATADPENGKVCWRADLTPDALALALGDEEKLPMYCCLWMTPSGGELTLICQWKITMHNIAVEPD